MKGYKLQIFKLLKEEGIKSSKEISDKVKISKDPKINLQHIRTYLTRLQTKNIITVNKKIGRENYYQIIDGIEAYRLLVDLHIKKIRIYKRSRDHYYTLYIDLLKNYKRLEDFLKSVIKPEFLSQG
jgi:predicted transcriptional regulator